MKRLTYCLWFFLIVVVPVGGVYAAFGDPVGDMRGVSSGFSGAVGSDGVTLTGSDGVLTVTGNGNGTDEAITFDFESADEITVGAPTMADGLLSLNTDFGALRFPSGNFALQFGGSQSGISVQSGVFNWHDTAQNLRLTVGINTGIDLGAACTSTRSQNGNDICAADQMEVLGVSYLDGGLVSTPNAVTGVDSLVVADCGRPTTVTAGIDGATITLPEASTVIGCTFDIYYTGADGGALVDISPLDSDADGIEGGCDSGGAVVTFSGTADADIGLTKATGLTGDSISITAVSASMFIVKDCRGIWANN